MKLKDMDPLYIEYLKCFHLNEIVYLREDSKGRYIEYAFINGTPPHNRCLDSFCKPHPKTWELEFKNNSEKLKERYTHLYKVDELYKLRPFRGCEKDPNCKLGCPSFKCDTTKLFGWDYDEPGFCASWGLEELSLTNSIWFYKPDELRTFLKFLENDK